MPFPSSVGTRSFTVSAALNLAQQTAAGVKARAQALSLQSASANVPASLILEGMSMFADAKANFTRCAAVPGLATYAQAQLGDTDIANEFNAMVAAVDAVRVWVMANFPKDGNGVLLASSFAPDNSGRTVQVQFTPAQLSQLRTLLDALAASID